MKQEDKKYEEWLTEIKNRQPILENPEELTAAILNNLSSTYKCNFLGADNKQ